MSISDTANRIIVDLCSAECPQAEDCLGFCDTAKALRRAIEAPVIEAQLAMREKPYPDEEE